jgi:hypothetical protein
MKVLALNLEFLRLDDVIHSLNRRFLAE